MRVKTANTMEAFPESFAKCPSRSFSPARNTALRTPRKTHTDGSTNVHVKSEASENTIAFLRSLLVFSLPSLPRRTPFPPFHANLAVDFAEDEIHGTCAEGKVRGGSEARRGSAYR